MGQQNHIHIHAPQENTNHLAIIIPQRRRLLAGGGGDGDLRAEGEALTDGGLDGGLDGARGGRDEVAELVGGAHHEGAEGAGGELHL